MKNEFYNLSYTAFCDVSLQHTHTHTAVFCLSAKVSVCLYFPIPRLWDLVFLSLHSLDLSRTSSSSSQRIPVCNTCYSPVSSSSSYLLLAHTTLVVSMHTFFWDSTVVHFRCRHFPFMLLFTIPFSALYVIILCILVLNIDATVCVVISLSQILQLSCLTLLLAYNHHLKYSYCAERPRVHIIF